jgi:hypothetical protein
MTGSGTSNDGVHQVVRDQREQIDLQQAQIEMQQTQVAQLMVDQQKQGDDGAAESEGAAVVRGASNPHAQPSTDRCKAAACT